MQANYVQRLRLTFSKTGPTRYISHLDLARTLERALNRARIPIAYTQGFNQRPRMSLATALPLGYTSEHELADIWLEERMEPAQAQARLMQKMAPGIAILDVVEVPLSADSLQTVTAASIYLATPLDPLDKEALAARIAQLLAADTLMRTRERYKRKNKRYDLRPLIIDLGLEETADGALQIYMHLTLQPSKTGRPDEVLLALGLDPLDVRVHRKRIVLQEEAAVS